MTKSETRNTLYALILAGMALRYSSAFLSLGASHPNEFYRLLEPIAALDGYATRLPWEWKEGLLSCLPVLAVRDLLHLAAWIGFSSPVGQLVFLKLIYANLSLLLIWATWRVLKKFAPGLELYGAAFVSLWPELIYQSVRLMDYSLEAAFFAGAVGLTLGSQAQKVREWIFAGILLGMAFFVRYQSGLDWLALVLASILLFQNKKNTLEYVGALILSYVGSIALLGALEAALTSRPFLDPFFRYIHFNWTQDGAARLYGVTPWHRYWSESAKYYGIFPFIVFVVASLWAPFKSNLKKRAHLPLLVLFYLPFLVYSVIAHKEGRFAYGFLWVLIPLGFTALYRSLANRRGAVVLSVVMALGWAINLSRNVPVYFRGSQILRSWSEQKDTGPSLKVLEGDPDFLPGGFFLHHRGTLCYQFEREGARVQEGDCK